MKSFMAEAEMTERCQLLDGIRQIIPYRDSQIEQLLSLFGEKHHFTCSSVLIYGHAACGKTFVIQTLMQTFQLPHALVNCVESYSTHLLFEQILNQVSNTVPNSDNNYESFMRCDTMIDLVRCLPKAIEHSGRTNETVYLILDKAERLRDLDANLLPAFLRLQELVKMNVCVILISELLWEKFRFGTGFCDPFQIHFPNYTKDELLKILSLDTPAKCDKKVYSNYINLVLSVFYQPCRNLSELRHLAALNFNKYQEPIVSGEVKDHELRKLWRNIEPHLKKALQTVYLHEVSSTQWEKMQESEQLTKDGHLKGNTGPVITKLNLELPFYSKYLLIAAYLASYNPVKVDKRFFMKHHGKIKKSTKIIKKNEKMSNHLLGPKPFPLDRLLAIFYSILEDRIAPTALIYSQLSSLVSLHLLAQMDNTDLVQTPRYKCLVSLEFIRSISKTVNFDIIQYLFDFI